MKLCQITVNDPIIIVLDRNEFLKLTYSQMVMKLIRVIMIKLL